MGNRRVGYSRQVELTLWQAHRLFRYAQSRPELAAAIARRGVRAADLAEGEALHAALDAAAYRVIYTIKERDLAERAYKEAVDALWDQGYQLAHLARRCFEGQRGLLYLLGLPRPAAGRKRIINPVPHRLRRTTAVPWLVNFYGWLGRRPELAQVLVERGYPAEELARDVAQAAALQELEIRWRQKAAQARRARAQRDVAYFGLYAWLVRTRRLARLALRDRRDWRALLGL